MYTKVYQLQEEEEAGHFDQVEACPDIAGLRSLTHCTVGNSLVQEMHGSNHFYIAVIYFSVAWTAKYK